MPDHRNNDAKVERDGTAAKSVDHAAPVAGLPSVTSTKALSPEIMQLLYDAALSADRLAGSEAVQKALSVGIRRVDLADHYIPAISRRMGDQWCSDELGFANVTIGTSRLQAMLRELGPDWSGDEVADPSAPVVMLVVLPDVYHTLGAMVLAGQLRRKGISVRLMLGARAREIVNKLQKSTCNAIFISSSRGERLESLRRIVDGIKTAISHPPPIAIGGTILEIEQPNELVALTGADHATSNLDEAVNLCGLTVKPRTTHGARQRT